MATNWPQQVNPLAWRSAFVSFVTTDIFRNRTSLICGPLYSCHIFSPGSTESDPN